jgi:PAS domain S-box-containing protein
MAPLHETPPQENAEELYEGAPFGYLSALPDGRIVRVNRTLLAWTGRAAADLVGRPVQALLTAPGRIFFETHVRPLLRMQGSVNELAYDIVRADGSTFPALVNGVTVRDAAGAAIMDRFTLVDATDRRAYERELQAATRRAEAATDALRRLNDSLEETVRQEVERRMRAEAALHQAQKMEALGQLTSSVAHDFNNLLGAILANLEVAERHADDKARRFIANALRSVARGEALTGRMLAFGRKQQLNPAPVDLAALVEGARDLLERSLGPGARLVVAIPPGLPPALVDANQLELALMNIAVNARHAMPGGGVLTVAAERASIAGDEPGGLRAGEYLRLSATDTGQGMDAATLARAAEPFFTTKPAGQGTGLGLSMIHGLAAQSGGALTLDSRPGEGTTVAIWLPVAGPGAGAGSTGPQGPGRA